MRCHADRQRPSAPCRSSPGDARWVKVTNSTLRPFESSRITARSDRASVRAQAERRAVNSTVQGSAADVVKRATLLVRDRLVAQGYAVTRGNGGGGKRCLYVNHMHDELVFETRRSDLPRVVPLIRSAMQSAFSHLLRVALVVKVKSGTSWGSLQPFTNSSLPP